MGASDPLGGLSPPTHTPVPCNGTHDGWHPQARWPCMCAGTSSQPPPSHWVRARGTDVSPSDGVATPMHQGCQHPVLQRCPNQVSPPPGVMAYAWHRSVPPLSSNPDQQMPYPGGHGMSAGGLARAAIASPPNPTTCLGSTGTSSHGHKDTEGLGGTSSPWLTCTSRLQPRSTPRSRPPCTPQSALQRRKGTQRDSG